MNAKHLILRIGSPNSMTDTISGAEADQIVSDYIDQGFRVVGVHVIGMQPEGVNVFYLLTKQSATAVAAK
jgi:nucleoside diphosphate kinase